MADLPSKVFGDQTQDEERTFALIAHLLVFVFPIFGPLVIYLLKKDTSKFVAYHAMQAGIFQLVAWIIGGATCGLGLVLTFLELWMAMKAYNGEWQGYPLIEGIGKD